MIWRIPIYNVESAVCCKTDILKDADIIPLIEVKFMNFGYIPKGSEMSCTLKNRFVFNKTSEMLVQCTGHKIIKMK